MLHPDRFNQTTQKAEWALANEMFKELNHAYDILKNPVKRNQYDYTIGSHGGHQSTYTNPSPQESRTEQQRPKQPAHTESSNYSNPAPWIRDTFRFFTILIFGNFRVAIFLGVIVYAFISPYCQKTETSNDNAPTVSTKLPPKDISPKAANRINTHPPTLRATPTPIPADYPEPSNGFVFKNKMPKGYGKLVIKNGSSLHAVAKLVDKNRNVAVYVAFIRANSDYKITSIPDGEYRLLFATGRGWDDIDGKFREGHGASAFEDPLIYKARRVSDGQVYDTIAVTLNAIKGGNAKTEHLDVEKFDNL